MSDIINNVFVHVLRILKTDIEYLKKYNLKKNGRQFVHNVEKTLPERFGNVSCNCLYLYILYQICSDHL